MTPSELQKLGISRNKIKALVEQEQLLRIGRGVYQLASIDLDDESQYRAATKRIKGKSAVCLISALAYYNLIDEIPKQTWLLVNTNQRSYQKDIRLFRSHKPRWNIGIEIADGYQISNIERTIVDAIGYQHRLGNIGIEALKKALREKLTSANKVMEMATRLKVVDKILPYLQALS